MFHLSNQIPHLQMTNWLASIGHRWVWIPGYVNQYLLVDNGAVMRAPYIGGITSTFHPTGGLLELGPPGRGGVRSPVLFTQALVMYESTAGLTGPG